MSNAAQKPEFEITDSGYTQSQLLDSRLVELTPRSGIKIERILPHRKIRTIGAWCFVDLFGPTNQEEAMQVAAHPHTGLQTVTWLFSGEVEHCDSLGSKQTINPGELNLMTAGFGISHSELSINTQTLLHGVQLWVALPNYARNQLPEFSHYDHLPEFRLKYVQGKTFLGEFGGVKSPAKTFSRIVGAEFTFSSTGTDVIELNSSFEYGILVISGEARIAGVDIKPGQMFYSEPGGSRLELFAFQHTTLILLGGEPFIEPIIMWWNFIGRSHNEIVEMRSAWEDQDNRFGKFTDLIGGRIPAPPMPNSNLMPRPSKA